jgi:cell division protein FtsB
VDETHALRAEIEALESQPFALERAIREDLELARPGETVVRFGRNEPHGMR